MKKRFIILTAIFAAMIITAPFVAEAKQGCPQAPAKTVAAGETWVVTETTKLSSLTIGEGASVIAPDGYSITLTVNGVETGQKLVTTAGTDTQLVAGTYSGNIVLTVATATPVAYSTYTFPFRQALYVNGTGVVDDMSVFASLLGGKVTDSYAKNINVKSTGECFNGIHVTGGTYSIKDSKIKLDGNGRSDFIGYGAAIKSDGTDTTVVVDGAKIINHGVARTAIVADNGSNMIVKNSYLQVYNGELPSDYAGTIDTTQMRSVPWMLSLSGNNRATNLLGTNTKASYINSYIGAEGWGVLSTDGCTTPVLTAINSTIAVTGEDGYGSYAIGDATERFLGCTIDVPSYATICRGGFVYYGDSNPSVVSQLNTDLSLGLTSKELKSLRKKNTVVRSDRFGVMWHGGGTVDVSGGTIFDTRETTFLDKGQAITITVDGSKGAQLRPRNGILVQVMDDDDPGPVMPSGLTTAVYTEPTGDVEVDTIHDIYTSSSTDAFASFSNIKLNGSFYNSTRGGISQGPFGPPSSISKNLVLSFENSKIAGVITSSTAKHEKDTISSAEYYLLGEVTNTAAAAVNNGVIVSLDSNSTWTVTGTSYLTSLTIEDGAVINAPKCYSVNMTVDGVSTAIGTGTYSGAIILTVTKTGNCHHHSH